MLNILYLINYAGNAGTEKYVYNLIKAFHQKRANCHLAYNVGGKLSDDIKSMNVPVLQVQMRHPFDIFAAKTIGKYCKENNIDVIHAQYPRENCIALLARKYLKNLKVVYTNHIIMENNFVWKTINKLMTTKNHKIIAVCNKGRDVLVENGYPAEKTVVIYNGIMPHDRKKPNLKLREELGISTDDFVITSLTRYDRLKGLDYLVETIEVLAKKSNKDFKLIIVGEGELWEEISSKISDKGLGNYIIQTGFREDAQDILGISDLYINTSQNEALSFAILEAMDNALPVVATNVGGNRDLVSASTDCGILVEYGDSNRTANAINTIMTDDGLRQKYGHNAQKAIDTVFNLERLLDKTFEMY